MQRSKTSLGRQVVRYSVDCKATITIKVICRQAFNFFQSPCKAKIKIIVYNVLRIINKCFRILNIPIVNSSRRKNAIG